MKPIARPRWARVPDVWLRDIRLADYDVIRAKRTQMLRAVHKEVEGYLNTAGLYFEGDDDGFPDRLRMTGDYYVSDESYGTEEAGGIRISILCHCLGRVPNSRRADDYLGLEVWLHCAAPRWTFKVFRNTDSSSI